MPDESPAQTGACPFCTRERTREYLLHEGDDFYVIADFAPIAAAHILLIPRAHYPHLAAIPSALESEFHALKTHIGDFVREHFGTLTYWENGVFGQSVPHAHLHSLSVEMDARLIAQHGNPVASLSDLREHQAGNKGPYFFVEHAAVGRVMPPDPQLYWSIISDAKVRNGGTWQYTAAERRVHGRQQVQDLMALWRKHHKDSSLGASPK